jgi:uncharacterized protein (DUF2147 family)
LVFAAILILACPRAIALDGVPEGVWMIDGRVAVQIFGCGDVMCGRVVWLRVPRDPQGQPKRDTHNPDPALRERRLCELTIFWNLRSAGRNSWVGGWFYNPDDGKTYRASAELRSADLIVARIYMGLPIFGETKTLLRIPRGTSDGWC